MTAKGIDLDIDMGIFEIMEIPDFVDHPSDGDDALSTGPMMTNPREAQKPPPPLDQQGVKDWKKKHGRWVAPAAQAASPDLNTNDQVDFTIQVLGERNEAATLALSLENHVVKSTRWKPPMSWVRHMAKSLGGRDQALALWWQRMKTCPSTFEKGFFQEHMMREPSHRERTVVERIAERPEGISKSEWQRKLYKGFSEQATDLQKSMSRGEIVDFYRKKNLAIAQRYAPEHAHKFEKSGEAKDLLDDDALSFYEQLKAKKSLKPKKKKVAKADDGDVSEKSFYQEMLSKALSPYDFNTYGPLKEQVNLAGDELQDYAMLYVDACARSVCSELRWRSRDDWYSKNPMPVTNARATMGDIEALDAVKVEPPKYKPDLDAIAKGCWEMLIMQLPKNKNLLKAKRDLKLTKDTLKLWCANVDYSKVC